MSKVIALITDFGLNDGFVGVMKGVIYSIFPEARIVDITHEIPRQDINSAGWILANSYRYFPDDTIFVFVVDPGVGGDRESILVETDKYYFIGPNNGLLTGVLKETGIVKVIELTDRNYWLPDVSSTFHGRDIFAPVAAHLAKLNCSAEKFGEIRDNTIICKSSDFYLNRTGERIEGSVVYIDVFGNIITNIPVEWVNNFKILAQIKSAQIKGLNNTYSDIGRGNVGVVKGSHGFLEVSVSYGNASKQLDVKVGDNLIIDILDDI